MIERKVKQDRDGSEYQPTIFGTLGAYDKSGLENTTL